MHQYHEKKSNYISQIIFPLKILDQKNLSPLIEYSNNKKMHPFKTPNKTSLRTSSSLFSEKQRHVKISANDLDFNMQRRKLAQQLEKVSVKKELLIDRPRLTGRPQTDTMQKDYRVRSAVKANTPYSHHRKIICSKCKDVKCNCLIKKYECNLPKYEEIDSEADEVLTSDQFQARTSKAVYLLKSIFPWRPATVLFDYPLHCNKPSKLTSRAFKMKEEEMKLKQLTFKVSEGAVSYNCFISAFVHNGFEETTGTCNINISGVPKPEFLREMNSYQRINHFPGIWQLGRKDNLWRNMLKMRRKFGKQYEFCPYTYLLPEDYSRFQTDREENQKALWILKPAALSCGRGIKVLTSKSKVSSKKTGYVVSKYISNPHILNGFKYDLRIYVGVVSFDPLRIYIYKEGLVRFATEKYSCDKKKIRKRYVHLTNFSVNKNSSKFVKNVDAEADGQGSKWSLKALRAKYEELGIDYEKVFAGIEDIVIKTCIMVEPHVVNSINQGSKARNNCFEVYGFDILVDELLKPWLLEVNVCPSLASSSPLDKQIKTSLMCDIFTLSNIVPYDRSAFEKEQEYIKSSRLFGFEKYTKFNYRNIGNLNQCASLKEYSLSTDDFELLADCEEDSEKCGNFKRIFPLKENIDLYCEYFDVARYNNTLLWKHLKSNTNILDSITTINY